MAAVHDTPVRELRLPYLDAAQRAFAMYRAGAIFDEQCIEASDGTRLTVLEAGDPRRPTVLLVNALGMSCLFLAEIARRLAREYHVVTWETRGLPNEERRDDADLSIERHCIDAAEVLARTHRKPHAVVSYCSGANVAVYALAKEIVSAKRLCIVSPSMQLRTAASQTDYQKTMLPLWEKIAGAGPRHAALVRVLLQRQRHRDDGSLAFELSYLDSLPFRSNETTYIYARLQAACLQFDWAELVGQVTSETLVLHADQDDMIHADTSEAVARGVPGAVFRSIRSAGHFAVYASSALHEEIAMFVAGR